MTIETKYDVGQEVYYYHVYYNRSLEPFTVRYIKIDNEYAVHYGLHPYGLLLPESELFPTREAAEQSLVGRDK